MMRPAVDGAKEEGGADTVRRPRAAGLRGASAGSPVGSAAGPTTEGAMMSQADADLAADLGQAVAPLLAANRYVVLGTTDESGRPWVTPVFFGADGDARIFWVSSPSSRHSRNLDAHPAVAGTVFDSTVEVGRGAAVYLTGTARAATRSETAAGLAALNLRLPAGHTLSEADVAPSGTLALYVAEVHTYSVLLRGGDPRNPDGVDRSVLVRSLAAGGTSEEP